MDDMPLNVADPITRILLVPAAVEVFGGQAELDNQDTGEVDRGHLTPLLLPQTVEGLLVPTHDDPGVRAADELAAVAYRFGGRARFGHSSAVHRVGAFGHLGCLLLRT